MKQFALCLALGLTLTLTGCDWMPGRPKKENMRPEPQALMDPKVLYSQNCLGCHGDGATIAGAIAMNDPFYLSVIPREHMRTVITEGVPHSRMPAFSLTHGGSLTDAQIEKLLDYIYAWGNKPPVTNAPPYSDPIGDVGRGQTAFGIYCASCHGADGNGIAGKAGSVTNPAYVGLVTDQYLRTIVIAGRSDLGCPDFQNRVPNKAMSNEEISDVVAWLASNRRNEFGQPLPVGQP